MKWTHWNVNWKGTASDMEILDINAVNFAGRVAHVAAAELYGLLVHGEIRPIANWFDARVELDDQALTDRVDAMAVYVAKRAPAGETLFRASRGADWTGQDEAVRLAYDLFASTVADVAGQLAKAQAAAEHALELATRPAAAPVKLEDTIFEPEESLGTLRPEAVAAAAQIAEHDKAVKAEARARRKARDAAARAEKAKAAHAAAQAKLQAAPTPLSVGEAPPAPPVNRGGRGRKKSAGDRKAAPAPSEK